MSLTSFTLPDPITIAGISYPDVMIVVGRYAVGDGAAVSLYTGGEPLATLTSNVPSDFRRGPRVWAKDYAENAGLVDELLHLGLLKRTGATRPSGFIELVEVELLGPLAQLAAAATYPDQPN